MATLNQLQPIESMLTPDESAWFRTNAPHFLDALRFQQTVINQLVIRAGGPGSGSNVVNLDAISARIEENAGQIAAVRAISKSDAGVDEAVADITGRLAKRVTNEPVDDGDLRAALARVSSMQTQLMQKLEELEALCLSSLAR